MRQKAQPDGDGRNRLLNRREYVTAAGGTVAAMLGVGTATAQSENDGGESATDGRGTETTGKERSTAVGGADGYGDTVSPSAATVTVGTKRELNDALSNASDGDVVYLEGDADVATGTSQFRIPAGVTLASDRGIDGSKGGRLATEDGPWGLLSAGEDARVSGLRIGGPRWEWIGDVSGELGIDATSANVEVDNCEVYGWGYASVTTGDDTHVHHNAIHHNPKDGTGYGVATGDGERPIVEYNVFHHNRHSVASSDGGYVARHNHVKQGAIAHVFDQHRPGGTSIEIYNNTIEAVENAKKDKKAPGVAVRGVPSDRATIHHNWFFNPDEPRENPNGWTDEAIVQVHVDDWRNVEYHDNHYGADEPDAEVGHPR